MFTTQCITLMLTGGAGGEKFSVGDLETWMSRTPHLMNLFDTVSAALFQFDSVRSSQLHVLLSPK